MRSTIGRLTDLDLKSRMTVMTAVPAVFLVVIGVGGFLLLDSTVAPWIGGAALVGLAATALVGQTIKTSIIETLTDLVDSTEKLADGQRALLANQPDPIEIWRPLESADTLVAPLAVALGTIKTNSKALWTSRLVGAEPTADDGTRAEDADRDGQLIEPVFDDGGLIPLESRIPDALAGGSDITEWSRPVPEMPVASESLESELAPWPDSEMPVASESLESESLESELAPWPDSEMPVASESLESELAPWPDSEMPVASESLESELAPWPDSEMPVASESLESELAPWPDSEMSESPESDVPATAIDEELADVLHQDWQAQVRRGVAAIVTNLARRLQTMLDRQVELVDQMELAEEDPQRLTSLFAVDHLAVRMRRSLESLLVLAEAEPWQATGAPVSIEDALQLAVGEIEHYDRVEIHPSDRALLAPGDARAVAHLCAELLDNATTHARSEAPTTASGRLVADGDASYYVIEIVDRGTGMAGDQLREANAVLADPPELDPSLGQSFGLVVVGRLAIRLGVTVRLVTTSSGSSPGSGQEPPVPGLQHLGSQGITAVISMPSSLLVPDIVAGRVDFDGPAPAAPPLPPSTARLSAVEDFAESPFDHAEHDGAENGEDEWERIPPVPPPPVPALDAETAAPQPAGLKLSRPISSSDDDRSPSRLEDALPTGWAFESGLAGLLEPDPGSAPDRMAPPPPPQPPTPPPPPVRPPSAEVSAFRPKPPLPPVPPQPPARISAGPPAPSSAGHDLDWAGSTDPAAVHDGERRSEEPSRPLEDVERDQRSADPSGQRLHPPTLPPMFPPMPLDHSRADEDEL